MAAYSETYGRTSGFCIYADCQDPGYERFHDLCRDHFMLRYIQEPHRRVEALQQEIYKEQGAIRAALAVLETPALGAVSLRIIHHCICGFISPSYIEMVHHVDAEGDTRGHRVADSADLAKLRLEALGTEERKKERQTVARQTRTTASLLELPDE